MEYVAGGEMSQRFLSAIRYPLLVCYIRVPSNIALAVYGGSRRFLRDD
jgi:hypothetical protein